MRAVHPERGLGLGTVVVGAAGQIVSARVLLDRGVPCAGTLTVPRGQVPEARYTLIVDDTESRSLLRTPVRFADGKAAFELTGLPPGEYLFYLSTERSGDFEPTPVVVPAGGSAEMELELELPSASGGRAFQAAEIDR